jgi:hypothetical protein
MSAGGAGTINLGGDGNVVTINAGSGPNYYEVDNGPGSFPTTLNTNDGYDFVLVDDSSGGLTVNTGSDLTDVLIGGPTG